MKNLWNKIKTPIKVGALATILSFLPIKSLAQESTNLTPKGKIKAGISYNLFSGEYLSEEYGSIVLISGGYEKKLSGMFDLGIDMSFGTKKEIDAQSPYKLIYFLTNIEGIYGINDDKDFSLYAIMTIGFRTVAEQDNEGSIETTNLSIGGNVGGGGQIKLSDNLYIFGEIKANIGKTMLYDELMSLNTVGFGGGLKITY